MTGEEIPVVGLGTWQVFDIDDRDERARGRARETLGVLVGGRGRLVDTSPMYGSAESTTGRLMADLGVRAQVFVATKVWTTGQKAGVRQMEDSMRKLGVEQLDLMQVHNLVDVHTHLATLRELRRSGRVRYLGITHYHAGAHPELATLIARGDIDFVQVNYSLAEPEAERHLLAAAAANSTAVIVNRPFGGGGMLRGIEGRPLAPWAAEIGCTSWAQVFLKWILAHPAVTCVIPATRDPDHMSDNLVAGLGPLPDAPLRRRMARDWAALTTR